MIRVLFPLLICTMANAIHAQSVTIDMGAQADNTLYQFQVNNSNALGANLLCGTNGGNFPRRPLIRFNISGPIPSGSTILSVTLQLNCSLTRNIADSIKLHKLTAAWGEGTSNAGSGSDGAGVAASANDATWLARFHPITLWTNQGGDFIAAASAGTPVGVIGNYTWSSAQMVTDVQQWLNDPATNFGWIMIGNETVASTARKFGSKDNSVAENRPRLTITYNPPGSTPTRLTEISDAFPITLYPNPVRDYLLIQTNLTRGDRYTCRIFDVFGRMVFHQRLSTDQKQINLQHLSPATYFIEISSDSKKKSYLHKIIKF